MQYPFLKLPDGSRVPLSQVFEISVNGTNMHITTATCVHKFKGINPELIKALPLTAYGFVQCLNNTGHWLNLNLVDSFSIIENDRSSEFTLIATYKVRRGRRSPWITIGQKTVDKINDLSISLKP
jgi:hypothetical protein